MSVKATFKSLSTIKTKLKIQPYGPAHAYLTKKCAEHMDKYVPFDEGGLSRDTRTIQVDRIIFEAPYAHYMYVGKAMGPSIPIKEGNVIVKWISPKGKPKYYTGKDLTYQKKLGHEFAGPYWDKRMWTAEKSEITKEVQDFINHGGK